MTQTQTQTDTYEQAIDRAHRLADRAFARRRAYGEDDLKAGTLMASAEIAFEHAASLWTAEAQAAYNAREAQRHAEQDARIQAKRDAAAAKRAARSASDEPADDLPAAFLDMLTL